MTKFIAPAFVALLLIACSDATEKKPEEVRPVRVITIGESAGQNTASYAADVRARHEVRLSFRVGGKIVERLVEVARAVADAGLRSVPTLIVLNMSGLIWWPEWMIDASGRHANLFSDPSVLRSQALLAETCAHALAGDASIRAFDVSNEIDEAQQPRRIFSNAFQHRSLWPWSRVRQMVFDGRQN